MTVFKAIKLSLQPFLGNTYEANIINFSNMELKIKLIMLLIIDAINATVLNFRIFQCMLIMLIMVI